MHHEASPPGKKDGVDYRFISEEAFLTLLEEDRFLEYAKVHGHYYGTLRDDVERTLSSGIDMVLEIDVQGAFQVREKCLRASLCSSLLPLSKNLSGGSGKEERKAVKISGSGSGMQGLRC